MLAPALLRSQLLSLLYGAVQRGELTKDEAEPPQGGVGCRGGLSPTVELLLPLRPDQVEALQLFARG